LRNPSVPAIPSTGVLSFDANDRSTTEPYDSNGNLLNSGTGTNVWDFDNRLIQDGGVNIVYDGDGNRVAETVAGVTTSYLIDTQNPTGLPQVIDELVSGSVTRTYAFGLQRLSENQLIGGAWTPSFYGYDAHGNVRYLTNAASSVTDTYQYDAFGNLVRSTGTTPNNYRFSGESFDPASGMYQMRARWYRQATGRFITRDPYQTGSCCSCSQSCSSQSCSVQASNAYAYADNDPVNRIDPSGKASVAIPIPAPQKLGRVLLEYLIVTAAVLSAVHAIDEDWELCTIKFELDREGGSGFHTCYYQCEPSKRIIKRVQFGPCDPYIKSF
jgi:RHS repeat-associated protein